LRLDEANEILAACVNAAMSDKSWPRRDGAVTSGIALRTSFGFIDAAPGDRVICLPTFRFSRGLLSIVDEG